MRLPIRRTLVAVPVALLLAASSVPAHADETTPAPDGLAVAKARVTARIDMRLRTLHRLDAAVDTARRLSDAHQETLSALIAADIDGLTELRGKVAGETTRKAVRADAQSMVNDYRIYILVRPKVRLTIVADREAAALDRLTDVHAKLADLVAAAAGEGKDVGNAAELLDAMQSQLDAAAAGMEGQAETLLAIQPGPDGAAIRSAVDEIRESLRGARQDLRDALATAKRIRGILRGLRA